MNPTAQDQAPAQADAPVVTRGQSSEGPPSGNLSLSEAASLLARRRSELRTQGSPTEPQEEAQAPVQDDQPDPLESDDGQPVVDEENLDEAVDDGQADADADDTDKSETFDDDAILLLDGQEVSIKELKEWRDGAMRQDDYQRKTQVLAHKVKTLTGLEETLNRQAFAMQEQLTQRQTALKGHLEQLQRQDWVALAKASPNDYMAKRAEMEQVAQLLQQSEMEMQRFAEGYEQLAKQSLQAKAQAALPEIRSRIRGWNDAMYDERRRFAVEAYGAEPETINRVTDPWFWEMANDAYLYRRGKQIATAKPKLKRATVTPRPTGARPAVGEDIQQAVKDAQQAPRGSQREAAAVRLLQAQRQRNAAAITPRRR